MCRWARPAGRSSRSESPRPSSCRWWVVRSASCWPPVRRASFTRLPQACRAFKRCVSTGAWWSIHSPARSRSSCCADCCQPSPPRAGTCAVHSRRRGAHRDGARRTIWTLSLATQALTQITYDGDAFGPVWAPDGLRVLFTHFPRGPERGTTMWSVPASGQGAREPVFEHPDAYSSGTSADGRVVYYHAAGENGWDTFSVALTDSGPQRRPLLTTPVNEQRPTPSPDGRCRHADHRRAPRRGALRTLQTTLPDGGRAERR